MDALVILVGVTADRDKRLRVREICRAKSDFHVLAPALPKFAGLRVCARWLVSYLRFVHTRGRYERVHFLNYISGGFLFRLMGHRLDFLRIGRVLYDRGPIQEELPGILVRRYTTAGVMLARGKTTTDLAAPWIQALPFPESELEQGLIIETAASRLARDLGLTPASPEPARWRPELLLPGASDVRRVDVSHDDVYTSPLFLDEAIHFLRTGRFQDVDAIDGVRPGRTVEPHG
jgi:hypothetical protein